MYDIPLLVPHFGGNEWKYIKECLDTEWVSSAGKYVNQFEEKITEYTGSAHAIACINGTSALQLSLRLVGVMPSDEVIVSTLTFIAPVNSIKYNGAEPIFMDADDYYNIDAEKTIEFIKKETVFKDGFTFNKKTNRRIIAIIFIHVFGHAAWLDEIIELCEERNISIVEDAAESLGTVYINGKYSGKHTGTIGKFGCLSFNGNKITTTGGGGMVLTNSAELADRAKYLTKQAKNDGIRYIHDEIGYNLRLTNIQAALGVAQLEQLKGFLECKKKIHHKYVNDVENISGLGMAKVPNYAKNNHWMNILQIDPVIYRYDRETIMDNLRIKGIQTRPVWYLNHLQKPYSECQTYKIERAHELVDISLCLPSSSLLSDEDISKIVSVLNG